MLVLLALIISALINFSKQKSLQISAGEEESLRKLYYQTNGDNWNNNDNWLIGQPVTNGIHVFKLTRALSSV